MGINTQTLVKNRLSGKITSLMLILLLFLSGYNVNAQVDACAGGVLQLGNTFNDMVPVPVPGHRSKGYWSSSPALTFNNVNDPNAIVSGFVLGTTYTITWHHQGGNDYILTVNVPNSAQVGDWSLRNENNTTDDVVLCGKRNYDFTVPWDGDGPTETYDFWVTHDADGTSEIWEANVSGFFGATANIKTNEYNNLDFVWAIVQDNDGCQVKTNEIRISDVASTQVRVQGGASACQTSVASLGLILEVLPFDGVNYTYQWYRNGGAIIGATGGTYPITQVGDYYVIVTGCGSTYTSNVVSVTEDVLPDAVISGGDICENPVGTTTTLSSILSGGTILTYDLEWLRNGVTDAVLGITGTATADAVGSYQLKLTSTTDDQCYRLSNIHNVNAVSPVVDIYDAVQPGSCLLTYSPVIRRQLSGGAGLPYSLTLREPLQVDRVITVNDNLDLTTSLGGSRSASTTIQLISVTDANGCITSTPLPIDAVFNFTPAVPPTPLNINGADVCTPNMATISLAAAENGVDYYLARNGFTVLGSTQTGDGASTLTWTDNVVGTYTVYAIDACGGPDVLMNGSVTVYQMPAVQNMTRLTGNGCSNITHVFGLDASESDVTYTLYLGAAPAVGVPSVNGSATNGAISFIGVNTPGTYTVYGQRGTCTELMNGSFVINTAPIVTGINLVGTDGCTNELKNIGISANESAVTYDLILNGNTAAPVASFVGDGTGGTKNFYALATNLAAGVYTVRATALNACEDYISGSITITNEPTDLPFVGGVVCGSGNINIPNGEIGVTYTLYYNDGMGEIQHPGYAPITPASVSTVSFNGLNSPGTYRVYASSGGCSTFLSNVLIVEKTPIVQVITIPDNEYCANETGVAINIGNTETGIDYVLIDNTGTDVATITGNSLPRSFTNVTQGTYSVEARSSSGTCVVVLMTNIIIIENALPNPDIVNLPGDFCEDQGIVVLIGNPTNAGGIWSGLGLGTFLIDNGNGTADFNPGAVSTPGATYSISYTYTDGNGCSNTITEGATVHANAIDATTLLIVKESDGSAPDVDYCLTSPDVDFRARYNGADIITNDAVFSGPGITDNGDGTATFSPGAAGLGTHTIILNYLDPATNCSGNTALVVNVGTPLNIVNPIAPSYCSSDNTPIRLYGQINGVDPAPGTTTFDIRDGAGNPIAGYIGIPNNTYDFVPSTFFAANGAGDYQIVYNYNSGSCVNELVSSFSLYESVNASFDIDGGSGQTTFCYETGAVTLEPVVNPLPAGATYWFVGNGVSGTNFITNDPNVVYSPATNPVTLNINNNGCLTTSSRNITVTKVNVSIVDLLSSYCTADGTQTIRADELNQAVVDASFTAEKNGNPTAFLTDNGDNTATIDPSVGAGIYKVTMTYTQQGDGCIGIVEQDVTIHLSQPVTFIGVNNGQKICRSSSPIDLIGDRPDIDGDGNPDGQGNFIEIAGVTNTGNDTGGNPIVANDGKALLDPSAMVPGNYVIRYEYLSNPGSCFTYFEKTIEIVDSPSSLYNVTVNGVVGGDATYCIDDAPKGVTLGLDGSNTGVTYELLLGGSPLLPAVTETGTGAAISFAGLHTVEGTYTVRANVGGCDAIMTGSATVEQYELVLQATNITDVLCKDDNTGSVTLSASGGSGSYEYKLEPAGLWTATPTFNSLSDGTYSFSVRDLAPSACQKINALSVTVNEPANALAISENAGARINVGCVPCTAGVDCEGSATIVITGGTPFTDLVTYPSGYDITWPASANNQKTLTATNLAAGTYTVSVEDANGCIETINVVISNNTPLDIVEHDPAANHIDNVCFGGSDGEFMVKASGGSGQYQFSLDGINFVNSNQADQTEHLFTGLIAGTYTVTIRDLVHPRCLYVIASNVIITEPAAALSLLETANTSVSCYGGSDGSFTVEAAGGNGTYEFSRVNPAFAVPADWVSTGTNVFTVSGIAAGNYSVWVRDAANPACTGAAVVVAVTESVQLALFAPVVANVTCFSGNDGQVALTGAGGSGNYVYSIDGGTTWQASNIFSGLSAGVAYDFSIGESATPNLCNQIDILSVTLTEPSDFTTTEVLVNHQDVSCFGGSDGSFTVGTVGGEGVIEYRLHDGTNYITAWDSNPVFAGLSVGTYEVSVRDLGTAAPGYCEKDRILPVTITQPLAALLIDSEVVTPANCNGSATGSILITVINGTLPYTYQWENTDTNTPVSLANGGQSANPVNLIAGNYEVVITDANGCPLTKSYVISDNPVLGLSLDSFINISCYNAGDGTITVSATGGSGAYQYRVNGGAWEGGPASTYTFTNLSPGLYTIQVEDLAVPGCLAPLTVSQTLTQPSQLDLDAAITDVSCFGLSDGAITVQGIGRALVTDYEYYCDEIGSWQASPDFTGLTAGDYNFKVRDKLLPTCESALVGPFTVNEPADFTTIVSVTPVDCNGGNTGQLNFTTLPASGIYTYSINGGPWQSNPVTGLVAGTYTLQVQNTNTSCIKNEPDVVITQPSSGLSIDNVIINDVDCNGNASGDVEVTVSGGSAPYTYQWRNLTTGIDVPPANNGDQAKAINLTAGNYQVTVNDNNGCSIVSPIYNITETSLLTTTYTVSHISVVGLTDGEIVVTNPPTGGTGPYSITWADGAAFDGLWTRSNLVAGTYTFTITDSNGCTFIQNVNVLNTLALNFTTVANSINCYAAQDGIIAVTITGGTADYTISWSGTLYDGSTTSGSHTTSSKNYEIKPLYAGDYTVVVTDANGATLSKTNINISQPNELLINNLVLNDISCNSAADGRIQVELAGHLPADMANYNMSWVGPGGYAVAGLASAVSDQSGLSLAGNYTVTVNYNSTCSVSETYTINEPTAINVIYSETHLSAAGANDGQIVVTNPPTGGVSPYNITWADGAGAFDGMWSRTSLAPGNYDFTVEDASGCTVTYTATILDVDALDYTYTVTPINCYGDQSGIISLVITGGVAPFDLHWDALLFDGSTPSGDQAGITTNYEIQNLYAGTYQVRITDGNGASISYPIIVDQPDELVINNVIQDDISCAGSADGHLQVSLSGHIPADMDNYILTWTGPGGFSKSGTAITTSDQPNLILPGTYTVTANYNGTCYVAESYIIDEPTPIVVNHTVTQISVSGGSDGQIVVDNPPSGGVAPYTISWSDGAAYDNVWTRDNLASGTYTYTVTDNINCSVVNSIDIDDLAALDYVLTANTINCYGGNTGIISVLITGGQAPYDIEWNGTQYDAVVVTGNDNGIVSNYEIKNLYAGTYTIRITDNTGALLEKSIVISQADELIITPSILDDISCYGAADGEITVNVNHNGADVTAYPIYWTGPGGYAVNGTLGANSTISNLALEGIYNAIVTYNGTCTVNESFNLNEPDEVVVSLSNSSDVSCNGGNDGSISVTVSGGFGFTYQWYKWDDALAVADKFVAIAGETNATISNQEAGRYKVEATLSSTGCVGILEHIITEPDALVLTVTPTNITTCNGDNTGELLIEISGGTQPYRYNYGTGELALPVGTSTAVIPNLFAGFYNVVVTDVNNCTVTVNNTLVNEPSALQLNVTNTFINCSDQAAGWPDGELTIEILGGVVVGANHNYLVTLEAATGPDIVRTIANPNGLTHTETFSNLAPDNYSLKVYDQNSSDANYCVQTYDFVLEPITITGNPVDASCEGVANGKITGITLDGVSANYTFAWTSPDGGIGIDPATLNQDGLSVGTYILTITDNDRGSCNVQKEFSIGYANDINIDGTTYDVECYGDATGAITLNVTGVGGSATYLWSGPGIIPGNETSADQTGLIAGDYTVLVTDALGGATCVATRTFTVKQPIAALDFNLRYLITSCDPYIRTIEIFNLVGGTGNPDPAFGEFKYNVSGPGTVTQDAADYHLFSVNKGGTYSVKISDKNDCETSYTITIPEEIAVSPVITDVNCNGGISGAISINLSGGSGSFAYDWTKTGFPGFTASTPNINNLSAGEYILVVTDLIENEAGTSCSRTYTFEVQQPLPIVISGDDKGNVTCNGDADGYINLEVQGGVAPYTYTWSPVTAGIVQGDKNQSGLSGGTYSVVVRDAHGCTAQKDITILEDQPISGVLSIADTQCDGTNGAITLTPAGGSGTYLYNWSTVDGDPANIVAGQKDQNGLTGGTYSVFITDADPDKSSCQTSLSATLTDAIDITNVDVQPVSCVGNNDGSISYDVIGGDGNYTYLWSTVDGSSSALTPGARNQSGLAPGTYTVVITDGRTSGGVDCAITRDFTIVASTGLNVNVALTHIECYGDNAGALSAVVSGGSGTYSYDWNGGAYATSSISGVPAGIYTLIVTDDILGCSYIGSYTINQPAQPITIDAVNITDVLCNGETTGAIEVIASGGIAPYNYLWTGPGNPSGSNPVNLAAGTYSVTIEDANGCTYPSGNIVITQPLSHVTVTNPQVTDVSVPAGNDGQIQVDVNGGVAPYTFEWYDSTNTLVSTTNPATGLVAGTYRVVVYDNNNCSFEYTGIRVVEPGEALGFEKTVHHVSPCNGDNNGELHINRVFGGFPISGSYYRIQVNGPGVSEDVNATSLDLTNLVAGTYRVIVTDNVPVTYQEDITIIEYPVFNMSTTVNTHVNCYGTATGVIDGTISGGQPNAAGDYLVEITSDKGYFDSQNVAQATGTFTFSNLPAGNYIITAFDYAGNFDTKSPSRGPCVVTDTKVINQPKASVVISSADGSSMICNGEDFNLVLTTSDWDFATNGSIAVTLYDGVSTWDELVNQTPYQLTVAPSTSRTYSISKVADPASSTCRKGTGSGQVQLTVNPLPTANITGPTEVCEDGTVQLSVSLTGVAPWSVTWVDDNNGTSNVETVNTSPLIINDVPIADASYRILSVSDANSCANSGNGQVDVTVHPKPSVLLSGSTNICSGGSATLDIEFGNTAYPYVISYEANGSPNTMIISPTAGTTFNWIVLPTTTTTYEITNVVDANGCAMNMVTTISAVVNVKSLPGTIDAINSTDDLDGVCQSANGVIYTIDPVTDADGGYIWTAPANSTIVSGNGTTSVTLNFDTGFTGGYLQVYATNTCGDGAIEERWIPAKLLPGNIGIISGPTEFCQGTTDITFSVAPVPNATDYRWELPPGFIVQGADNAATIKVDLDPILDVITADIKVTPYNACGDGLNTASLTVDVYPLPTADAGIDDLSHCGNTYTLNATDPATINPNWSGRWDIISGYAVIANPNAHNSAVSNLSRGEVIFRWTVTNNSTGGLSDCEVYDEVIIRNNTLSVSAVTAENSVCNGSTSLSGTDITTANTTGRWEAVFPVGSTAVFSGTTTANTDVSNMMSGRNVFRWTLTQNGCESYGEVEVENNEPSDAVILDGNILAVCDDEITLNAEAPLIGNGRWTLISGSGVITTPNAASTLITGLDYGDNVFRYTVDNNGCGKYAEITVRNNVLQVDAGADDSVCDGVKALDATVPPSGVIGRWIIAEGAGSFDDGFSPTATVTNLAQGINRLVWELNQAGCISTDEIVIANNEPTSASVGSNQVICAYDTQLSGNSPAVGVGFWSVVSGSGIFDDPADPTTFVRNLGEGNNIFRWSIINNSCISEADIMVTNLHVQLNAGKDSIVCGRITRLHANTPTLGVGEWGVLPGVGGATISDRLDPNTQVGGLMNGPNGFIWKVTYNGCESRDTVIINNNTPYPVNAGTDQIIAGGATTLNATPVIAGVGQWTLVAGGATIDDDADPFTMVSGLRRGDNVLRWTVTNLGCTEFDDVTITNGETIDADAGLDQVVCDNFAYLQANDPDVGIGEWSVVSGAGQFDQINNQKTKVNNLGPGDNIFRWTIYYTNSSSTDEVTITNNQVTKANAGPDREICGDEYQLEANIPAIGGANWTLISGSGAFDNANDPNTFIRGLSQGENVIKYEISQLGCSSIDSVIITNKLPTIAYAGEDDVICTDSIELRPNTPTFGIGEWRVKEGSALIEGNWAKSLAPGRNVLSWVITSGSCVSSDDIIIINNMPSQAYAGQDRVVCTDNVKLSSNIPLYGVGQWELVTGSGTIVDPLDSYTDVTGLATGKNRFRWTIDNNGCTSSDDVEISNNFIESFAGFNQINCADTALLEANNPFPGEGTWGVVGGSGSAYFDEPNNPYSKVRNLDHGDNILTWTIRYEGCNSTSNITITNNNPTPAQAGPDQPLCVNNTVLAANTPIIGAGEWTIRNGSGGFSSISDPSAVVSNLAFGDNVLRWTVTNQGCESIDDVQISFNRIDASVGPSQPICADETQLEANNASPGIGTWSIVGGSSQAVFDDQNNPNTIVRNLAKGDNQLTWTVLYKGCETSQEVTITNNSPSEAYAGNSQTICDDVTNLNATAVQIGVGRWEVLTGSGTITDVNDPKSEVNGLSKGDNVFRWIVQNQSCIITDEVLIVNNKPSIPYAGKDEELCTSQLTLKASPPEYGSGLWTIESGGGNFDNPTDPSATISNLAPGTTVLRWTLTQGQCTLMDEITVENNSPSLANAGPDVQDCKDWAQLDANVPVHGSGSWSVVSGIGDFDAGTDPKTTIRNLGFGENVLMWTIQNGACFSTDQVKVFNKVPDQAAAGSDRVTCDDYIVLNANNPVDGSGTWTVISGSGTFDDPNQYNTMVSNIGYGNNVYKWTIGYGECTTEDEVMVTSNKAAPYAGEDDVTYTPEYEMQAENPGALGGTWTIVAGGGTFEDPNFFNTTVTNLPEGKSTYRWTIVTDGCSAYDDVTIEYKRVPESGFTTSVDAGCYPLDVKFTNYTIGGTTFEWDFGDGSDIVTTRNPSHTYTEPGVFTVILTAPGPDGQDAISSHVITVHDHPVANFNVGPEVVWIPNDPIKCTDLSIDAVNWIWDFGDGNTSAEQNPTHYYEEDGVFNITLRVENEFGCDNTFVANDIVEAKLSGFVTFPDSFAPRPDGSSGGIGERDDSLFKPKYRDVDQFYMQIFNRWGQLIFETHDIDEGWDGLFKDKLAPQAVYVYKASGQFVNGVEFNKTGTVLLVR